MGTEKEKAATQPRPLPERTSEETPSSSQSSTPENVDFDDIPDSPVENAFLDYSTNILDDGRIAVNLDSKLAHVFAKLIEASEDTDDLLEPPPAYSAADLSALTETPKWQLPLSIVVQVVGSRGDVQPFVALGNELQRHGHRVRIATHNVFKDFVRSAGLEFYPIGGNPSELMAYMVKNPGLIPRMRTLREGEIGKKRDMIAEMLTGCWNSCIAPDPETEEPFVANAIIANPPSFAHIHCAQALGIPLHIVFTMPWSPTRSFPHPLANIQNSTTDPRLANYISYGMIQLLTWNGIGDVVQDWRRSIDLEVLPRSEAPFLMETLKIPHTYCWSPSLVPKPGDWGKHIEVSGFLFRDTPEYTPQPDLEAFLSAGPDPIYIGFGSIVIDDPGTLLETLLSAIHSTGTRAIISKGWSNLSSNDVDKSTVFFLGDCPHEWLFKRVSAVVHHGGAGTTACGLLNGRPTTVVPFFGDQQFWGNMVATSKAGPPPIPFKKLNAVNLATAIRYCLSSRAADAAAHVAQRMSAESGVRAAVDSFHRNLPIKDMTCDLIPGLPATWEYTKSKRPVRLSGAAVEILLQSQRIKSRDLALYKSKPIIIENRRYDFITSAVSVQLGVAEDLLTAASGLWTGPRRIMKNRRRERAAATMDDRSILSPEDDGGVGSSKDVARMVGASAMTIPNIFSALLQGFLVDIPLAVSEGMRNTPKLYGEKVRDYEAITDWKSGITVAGKSFAHGLSEGLTDLVTQPAKGLAREGAIGFSKGVGKGAIQTLTKPASAIVGLVGYTGQGVYKSIYSVIHSKTKKAVASAHRVQDKYFIRANGAMIDTVKVLEDFDEKVLLIAEASRSGSITPATRTSTQTSLQTRNSTATSDTTSISSPSASLSQTAAVQYAESAPSPMAYEIVESTYRSGLRSTTWSPTSPMQPEALRSGGSANRTYDTVPPLVRSTTPPSELPISGQFAAELDATDSISAAHLQIPEAPSHFISRKPVPTRSPPASGTLGLESPSIPRRDVRRSGGYFDNLYNQSQWQEQTPSESSISTPALQQEAERPSQKQRPGSYAELESPMR